MVVENKSQIALRQSNSCTEDLVWENTVQKTGHGNAKCNKLYATNLKAVNKSEQILQSCFTKAYNKCICFDRQVVLSTEEPGLRLKKTLHRRAMICLPIS